MHRPKFQTPPKNERQASINNFRSCILHNQSAVRQLQSLIDALGAFIGTNATDDIATAS